MTKKPVHAFSLLAAVVIIGIWATNWWSIHQTDFPDAAQTPDFRQAETIGLWLRFFTSTALYTAQIAGLAVLIEIVDQIRWRSLDDDERLVSGSRYLLARMGRLRGG